MTRDESEAIERLKASLARELEERKIAATWAQEEQRHQNAERLAMGITAAGFANEALRGLLLVNGGACVAILTFLGNAGRPTLTAYNVIFAVDAVRSALTRFSYGLGMAVMALLLAYVSQTFIRESGKRLTFWVGGGGRLIACGCATASLALFIAGTIAAVRGVGVVPPIP